MQANRTIWILALAGALTAPALAGVPTEPARGQSEPARGQDAVFPLPQKAAAEAAAAGREARRRRLRARGPVHPIVGQPDYGTPENGFGAARSGHMHSGQDVFAPSGTPLVAVAESVVIDVGSDAGQGNYVHLYDEREDRTYIYMHMVAPASVKAGQRVSAGERLGGVGCTGSCWGDHLHFEVRDGKGFGGQAQDPLPLLRSWESAQR